MQLRKISLCLATLLAGMTLAPALLAADGPHANERYVMVSHGADSDSWWNVIKNSVKQASEDFGVPVDYRNPPNGDLADMARLLEQAAARNYDGVAYDIADYDVLSKPAARITAKGIPTVTFNSGTAEESKKLGAIMHIGQPEYAAGKAAGDRAKALGIKSFVCVNHYATNQASFQRCKGFADAIGVDYKSSMIDSGMDPTVVGAKVTAYLRNHPTTQAILALGPNAAEPTVQVLKQMHLNGKIYFGIDQQPYLQGYMAVASIVIAHEDKTTDKDKIIATLKANPKFQMRLKEYGLSPVYNADGVSSGPAFVTKDNVAAVEKYAGQYR